MNANLTEVLKSIPDYDDFVKLIEEIGELSFKKMQLDNRIKASEADTFRKAMAIAGPDGKLPSATYVTNAYSHTGLNGELTEQRELLADYTAMLEKRKLLLSVYRDMVNIFQTLSANERSSGF